MLNNKVNTNESGRSMIEMLGVLAIIGVLSVGGIAGYSKAMNKFKINKTFDQIAMTVTNIRTMFAQQGDYTGLNNEVASSLGLVDDTMGSGATLKSPFGAVTIASASADLIGNGTADSGAFTIKLDGLSKDACVALVTNSWGSAFSAGFLGVSINKDLSSDCTTRTGGGGATEDYACSVGQSNTSALINVVTATSKCADNSTVWIKYY